MIADLDAWSARCSGALAELESEIARVREEAAKRAVRELKTERQVRAVMEEGKGAGGALGTRSGGHNTRGKAAGRAEEEGDDEMDVDVGEGVGGKKGGGGLGGFMGRFGRSGGR